MNIFRIIAAILGCILAVGVVAQTVYETRDAEGVPVFSDTPSEGATKVQLKPLQTFTAPETTAPATSAQKKELDEPEIQQQTYTSLKITEPTPKGTVWSSPGVVRVNFSLAPPLQANNKLNIRVDGAIKATIFNATTTSYDLKGIDKGEHTLLAEVVNEQDEVLISSEPVEFFLQRVTRNSPTRAANPVPVVN